MRVAATVFAILATTLIQGQDTGGRIEGRLTTPDGGPVVDATIAVEGPALMAPRLTRSDGSGRYRIDTLALGTYRLVVTHAAFEGATIENVLVRLGSTTSLGALALTPAAVFEERLTILAEPPRIDPISTSIGGSVPDTFFENVPVDRDYTSVAALLPHVTPSYLGDGPNFGGATGLENRYFIDGVDVTDPFRGMSGLQLPHNFVQDVEVRVGGYEAEYRSALGGVVNVVTPSGGERFAGEFFGYYSDHRLAGSASHGVTELDSRNFRQYDAGFSVSGPLTGDRLRFFVAYNPAVERVQVEIPGVGYFDDQTKVHHVAGKITWQASASDTVAFTLAADPSDRDAVGDTFWMLGTPVTFENPDPYLRRVDTGGTTLSARWTRIIGVRAILETAVSLLRRDERNVPDGGTRQGEVFFIDMRTGTWSGGSPATVDMGTEEWTAGAKLAWTRGRHDLKAGLEYRVNQLDAYAELRKLARVSDSEYQDIYFWQDGTVRHRLPSAFVQDSWRIGESWTLNAGLRWDGFWLVGSDGRVAQTIKDQYQPRLGFVYQPGGSGTQRVFGSAARYYQELMTAAPSMYHIANMVNWMYVYDHDPRLDPSGGVGFEVGGYIRQEVPGLRGQSFDELTLGYQRALGTRHRWGVRGVYRNLRDGIEDILVPETFEFILGNPGRGSLTAYPEPRREYTALELTFERLAGARTGYLCSYVISESRGNYPGLFDPDRMQPFPNVTQQYDFPEELVNADGLLPNDRTHVFKASGFYRFPFGLGLGSTILWASGTPLSEMGGTIWGPSWYGFIVPRGSVGRTPSIFDLGVRIDFTFRPRGDSRVQPRLVLDAFHLLGDRDPVDYDQVHYFNVDENGNQINPNPTYGQPTRYYPPATVRLGLEVSF